MVKNPPRDSADSPESVAGTPQHLLIRVFHSQGRLATRAQQEVTATLHGRQPFESGYLSWDDRIVASGGLATISGGKVA